ncbi:Hypothetical protein RY69_459 [Bifidobacterium breve]|nr:Hypothetical protein RY69_459 [Bifidobacterium breve]
MPIQNLQRHICLPFFGHSDPQNNESASGTCHWRYSYYL